jgi:hypothetical protein
MSIWHPLNITEPGDFGDDAFTVFPVAEEAIATGTIAPRPVEADIDAFRVEMREHETVRVRMEPLYLLGDPLERLALYAETVDGTFLDLAYSFGDFGTVELSIRADAIGATVAHVAASGIWGDELGNLFFATGDYRVFFEYELEDLYPSFAHEAVQQGIDLVEGAPRYGALQSGTIADFDAFFIDVPVGRVAEVSLAPDPTRNPLLDPSFIAIYSHFDLPTSSVVETISSEGATPATFSYMNVVSTTMFVRVTDDVVSDRDRYYGLSVSFRDPQPELRVESVEDVSLSEVQWAAQRWIGAKARIVYNHEVTAETLPLRVVLSADAAYDPSDATMHHAPALPVQIHFDPGKRESFTLERFIGAHVPVDWEGGTAYLIAMVDPGDQTAETVETDNAFAVEVTIPALTIPGLPTEQVFEGTEAADGLPGTDAMEIFRGHGGDDRILARGGNDLVDGGAGDDYLSGADGIDAILGGDGNDTINAGAGRDDVSGGAGDDVIRAGLDEDRIWGRDGADWISGWRGADSIEGGAGDDTIRGDFDMDEIEGGPGADRILGGPDIDRFVFRPGFGEDRILDFNPYRELLDFRLHPGVAGIADLGISQVGAHTVILDGEGGRIVLAETDAARITESDFLF